MKERIKTLRKSLDLSQAEFGEKVGLTAATISRIEAGERNASTSVIKLICTTYHVNYLWLTEGEGPMMEAQDTDALVDRYLADESEWARSIVKAFCRLPDAELDRFISMLQRIKKEGHP